MQHIKISFFLSGLWLCIEVLLVYLCIWARVYLVGVPFFIFTLLDVYRIYRKVQFLKSGPSREERERRADLARQGRSYYWNLWFRFADAPEHEFIAQKFHKAIKKTQT
jgi:fatty acid desaturase